MALKLSEILFKPRLVSRYSNQIEYEKVIFRIYLFKVYYTYSVSTMAGFMPKGIHYQSTFGSCSVSAVSVLFSAGNTVRADCLNLLQNLRFLLITTVLSV